MKNVCAELRRVDTYFDGTLAMPEEQTMRAHLPGCEACTARYERLRDAPRLASPAASGSALPARASSAGKRPWLRSRWLPRCCSS